jgi:hypothetical protein
MEACRAVSCSELRTYRKLPTLSDIPFDASRLGIGKFLFALVYSSSDLFALVYYHVFVGFQLEASRVGVFLLHAAATPRRPNGAVLWRCANRTQTAAALLTHAIAGAERGFVMEQ